MSQHRVSDYLTGCYALPATNYVFLVQSWNNVVDGQQKFKQTSLADQAWLFGCTITVIVSMHDKGRLSSSPALLHGIQLAIKAQVRYLHQVVTCAKADLKIKQ